MSLNTRMGEIIRERRKEVGVSVESVIESSGLTQARYYAIERGAVMIMVNDLYCIAESLETTADKLLSQALRCL